MSVRRIPRRPALAAALLALLAGCGPGPATPPADCPELPGRVKDRTTPLVVALLDEVAPHRARSPRNDAEWMLVRHLYEGLVETDCGGELRPALAESWSSSPDHRTWTFRIRAGRRLADGRPVTAATVRDAWQAGRQDARGFAHRWWLWRGIRIRDVTAAGPELRIDLTDSDPALPARLARPEFFVMEGTPDGWPLGTRDRRVLATPDGRELRVDGEPPVTFRRMAGTDPRDALPEDVDMLVSRDREALRFLAARPDTRLTPLPWNRRYVLADPTGAFGWLQEEWPRLPRELADEVVASIARVPRDAAIPGPAGGGIPGAFALRYLRDDADGRALAARVASLVNRREGSDRWITVPAPPASLFSGETATVVALPRADFDATEATLRPLSRSVLHPLVETRAHLVTRPEVAGIRVDADGVPRFDDAGRTDEALP